MDGEGASMEERDEYHCVVSKTFRSERKVTSSIMNMQRSKVSVLERKT
jgi:hypothetical protein